LRLSKICGCVSYALSTLIDMHLTCGGVTALYAGLRLVLYLTLEPLQVFLDLNQWNL
jgi:hypothetical protein